jgi:amidase
MAALVRSGRLTATDLVARALAAAAELDPVLHFMAEDWSGPALAAAARLDALPRDDRGPLAGVPFLVKAGTVAKSPVVGRLMAAGAIAIGASTRPDPAAKNQAWGWNGRDHTGNPWAADRSSGGSSAGAAAAVAAGVVPIATGADGAGSLRIPAAFCGVTALKGTYGRVPRAGGRSRTQRIVSGVIGASLGDVVLATSLVSGPHPADPTALPWWPVPARAFAASTGAASTDAASTGRPLRVAFSPDLGFARPDPAVADLVRRRVRDLTDTGAAELADVTVRLTDPAGSWLALADLEAGRPVDPGRLDRAYDARSHNDGVLAAIFEASDVLVTPTTPEPAFPIGEYEANLPAGHLCWAFNLSGHPAVTVPAGLLGGLPVGLQAITAHHREDLAIAVATLGAAALPDPPVFSPWTARLD